MLFANRSSWLNILRRVPLCLLALALLAHCGVNETARPAAAKFRPLPQEYAEKYAIKDEYFVSVKKRDGLQYDKEYMDAVHKYLLDIRQLPPAEEQISMPELSWTGCGGTTTREQYENELTHSFCLRIPRLAEIHALLTHNLIESIEPHRRLHAAGVQVCPPSWGLDRIDQPPNTKGNGVFSYSRTGNGVHIYLFDTGISNDPNRFNQPLGKGLCYNNKVPCTDTNDTIGHGTILAEIMAGRDAGVAKNSILHPYKIFHSAPSCRTAADFSGETFDVSKAIELLKDEVCSSSKVKQPSIAVLPFTTLMLENGMTAMTQDQITKFVRPLLDCDFVVIVAAGNISDNSEKYSPAGIPEVITVSSFNKEAKLSWFSNFGNKVDIIAPGEGVEVTLPDSIMSRCPGTIEGTSAAAAFTAGVAAQILEARHADFIKDNTKNMTTKVLEELIAASSPGIDIRGTGTPDRGLRSPYGKGTTGETDADGRNDAVSFVDCPPDSSCVLEGFCMSRKVNHCNYGIERPLRKWKCGRGVSCENGDCQSCGLNNEVCCDKGVSGSFECATEDLQCKSNTGRCERCGGAGEPCCENADEANKCRGGNLTCGTSGLCELCGKKDLQCCGNSGCDSSLTCEMSTNKCVCGGAGQPCCGFDCYPGSQCDSNTRTCKICGGPGQDCCLSPAPACQGDMMCNGGKCKGECYARCKNGLLLYGASHIDHGSCLAFGEAKCSECSSVKSNQLLRATYNYYYLKRENHCPPSKGQECEACKSDCPMGTMCSQENRPTGAEIKCSAPYCIDGGSPTWCINSRDSCQ